jgi:hypothetical protein
VVLLISSAWLANRSWVYVGACAAQIVFYALAALGSTRSIPILTRIAAPASAFCMLNAAVVVGFYKFLFTRGPLWRIWTSGTSASMAAEGADWTATMLSLHSQDQMRAREVMR